MKRSKLSEGQVVFVLKQAYTGVSVKQGCRETRVSEATLS